MTLATTRAHCNGCGKTTNQDILASDEVIDEPDTDNDRWSELHEMLKCRGCDSISLRQTKGWKDEFPPAYVVNYPPSIARRAPKWVTSILQDLEDEVDGIPSHVCGLMREVYSAAQNGSHRLVAMGIRATIEGVMIDKVGDHGTFAKNLDAMMKAYYLSDRQRGNIDTILGAGDAAIHRAWKPASNKDISTLLDITESLINVIYLHSAQVEILGKSIPPRPPRKPRAQP